MDIWDSYQSRVEEYGITRRDRALSRAQEFLCKELRSSLSYHEVLVKGEPQGVTILNKREDIALKKICALPGEPLPHGGLVDFANSKWLITELDANNELYASGLMKRCNYVLKWINSFGEIVEKWCVVEDGTKYLIGEKSEDILTIGDARVAVTIGKDSDTVKLGRKNRFLIDDLDSGDVLAYQISKPNKLFNNYNGEGVFRFILTEVPLTDNDNKKLRIADYYSWEPFQKLDSDHIDKEIPIEEIVIKARRKEKPKDDKGVWI